MSTELTEEEMRRALFGEVELAAPGAIVHQQNIAPVGGGPALPVTRAKKRASILKGFTPRLRVTLRVGNDFEGQMHELVHDADTLSSLLAEQEAIKAARKKFRYVEVVSVKSM